MSTDLGPILKAAYPQVVATLTRVLGDMDRAMDATQDALVKALQNWEQEGIPRQPVAWLVTVGRNRAIDVMRRDARAVSLDENVVPISPDLIQAPLEPEEIDQTVLEDDLLRLMFTCCHPLLNPPAQITLVLKVVLGFTVDEIGRALLASPASIEKRITRAKQRLREADVEYEVPEGEEIPARLSAVLQAIYLLFNEGYSRIQDTNLVKSSLIDEAIRLGRMTSRLCRYDPQPRSLLALMLLTAARLPGRVDPQGRFVPLEQQDRGRWNQAMIGEGTALIDAVYAARHPPGAYQIQAAISSLHCQAQRAENTDWPQIVALYEKLKAYDNSPVVPVNQAVALAYAGDPEQGLEQLQAFASEAQLKNYQPYFAALGALHEHLGHTAEAVNAYERAVELSTSAVQRAYLLGKLNSLNV